ncbi:MAG: hypothetical protein ACRERU_05700, partial [Methylococcales bacterium]
EEKGKPGNWGKSRPIFSIEFRDVSKLVLKGEFKQPSLPGKLAAQSLKVDSRIMKQVSPEAKIKLISESECTVLLSLLRRHFATGQVGERTQQYLTELLKSGRFAFFKMGYQKDLEDLNCSDTNEIRRIFVSFRDEPAVLKKLGEIVAVDFFIGNTDRFDKDGRIVNYGNVFLLRKDVRMPVGLDFFAESSESVSLFGGSLATWEGKILKDVGWVLTFSEKAINCLNEYFSAKLPQLTSKELLGPKAVNTLAAGIAEGSEKIKAYLKRKIGANKAVPSGVMERMKILGWLKN